MARTLLSAAFDVDFDFDFDSRLWLFGSTCTAASDFDFDFDSRLWLLGATRTAPFVILSGRESAKNPYLVSYAFSIPKNKDKA